MKKLILLIIRELVKDKIKIIIYKKMKNKYNYKKFIQIKYYHLPQHQIRIFLMKHRHQI